MTIELSFLASPLMQDSSPQYEVTWLIRRLFRAMAALADSYLRSHGLAAADRAVLEFLYPEKALSVPEIAARYQVSRQHIQVTVNALREDGCLETRPNPRHKRSPLIALTHRGRELFRKIRTAETELVDDLFAGIPMADIECTRRTLQAMYFHNLEQGEHREPD